MEVVITIVAVLVGLWLIALPVKMAAAAMGAERTGVFWCLLALIGSGIMHGLGTLVPCIGSIVAFLLSAVAFAAILGTGFLRGIAIEILVVIFSAILGVVVMLVLGVGFGEMIPTLMEALEPVSW